MQTNLAAASSKAAGRLAEAPWRLDQAAAALHLHCTSPRIRARHSAAQHSGEFVRPWKGRRISIGKLQGRGAGRGAGTLLFSLTVQEILIMTAGGELSLAIAHGSIGIARSSCSTANPTPRSESIDRL